MLRIKSSANRINVNVNEGDCHTTPTVQAKNMNKKVKAYEARLRYKVYLKQLEDT